MGPTYRPTGAADATHHAALDPAYLSAEPADLSGPVLVAPRVWWVGAPDPVDPFQTLAYVIEAGDQSVLVDPGSTLTIDTTLEKVEQVVGLGQIRWIVCHHSDPDIADSLHRLGEVVTRPDARVVTEWRAEALLRHYGGGLPFLRVEEHGWRLDLGEDRALEFQLTPYLHFPGAMVSYETASRVLFSSDIFGAFLDVPRLLADESYDEAMRPFHQHYMPSHDLLSAGLTRVRERWPDIAMIAPQHGSVIPGRLVDAAFAELLDLECGVFAVPGGDLDLTRLVRKATAIRRITEALVSAHDIADAASDVAAILATVGPITGVAFYVRSPREGWLRIDRRGDAGTTRVDDAPAAGPGTAVADLTAHGDLGVVLAVALERDEPVGVDWFDVVHDVAPAAQIAAERYLTRRSMSHERTVLRRHAEQDPLTGLLNRRALDSLDLAPPFSAIMLDVDHFKAVNDEHGHAAGDEVLRDVADVVRAHVRTSDLAIRYGGEEVLVLLPQTPLATAQVIAERIHDVLGLLGEGFGVRRGPASVTASLGVAEARESDSLVDVIEAADAAMYEAKRAGRDRVVVRARADG